VERSILRVADCLLPTWEVTRAEGLGADGGRVFVEAELRPGRDGAELDATTVVAELRDGTPLTPAVDGTTVTVEADVLGPGKHTVVLRASDDAGRAAEELLLPVWVEEGEPFDWQGGLIYQIVVDRFAPSGEPFDLGRPHEEAIRMRHGGDLVGLADVARAGYFEEMGVGALWISPLYDTPEGLYPGTDGRHYSGYHGYWPVASRAVEPLVGGEAALEDLVAELHARGIRLIVDVVPNHVHIEHPLSVEHAGSDWWNGDGDCVCGVTCSWTSDIDRCWFTPYLADFRWRNPEVVDQVVADTLFWLEAFDLDGLRVDAVPMMPRLAVRHLAWAARRRFDQGPTSLHLLGETYTGAGGWSTIAHYIGPYGLDGQFDFPAMWQTRSALAAGEGTMTALDEVIRESEQAWEGSGAVMSPFIGNHDVPRFLSVAAGTDMSDPWDAPPPAPDDDEPYERLLLAHALTLTMPGAPIIYYGDEYGMPGAGDPDNRRVMRFDGDLSDREAATLESVRRLGRARVCSAALRRGSRQTLLVTDDQYVYLRDTGDGRPAVVVLNRADEARSLAVDLPHDLDLVGDRLEDILSDLVVSVVDASIGPIDVPARSALVLVPAGGCE